MPGAIETACRQGRTAVRAALAGAPAPMCCSSRPWRRARKNKALCCPGLAAGCCPTCPRGARCQRGLRLQYAGWSATSCKQLGMPTGWAQDTSGLHPSDEELTLHSMRLPVHYIPLGGMRAWGRRSAKSWRWARPAGLKQTAIARGGGRPRPRIRPENFDNDTRPCAAIIDEPGRHGGGRPKGRRDFRTVSGAESATAIGRRWA